MRDPYLTIISVLLNAPSKPLKFYLEASKVSRGTFFKGKAKLLGLGIICAGDDKQIVVDRDKCLRYLTEEYPGVSMLFAAAEEGSERMVPANPTAEPAQVGEV